MNSSRKIRIDQFLAGYSPYDAISNEALIIQEILRENGYESDIFAEHLHPAVQNSAKRHYEYRQDPNRKNFGIYHFSIGSAVTTYLAYQQIKLIVRYHNVTPPEFFSLESDHATRNVAMLGKKQITVLDHLTDCIIADSAYNLRDFSVKPGRIAEVLPILRDYSKLLKSEQDSDLAEYMQSSQRNFWLFVGRIAPNKAQHDILITLKIYQQTCLRKTALILIGSVFSQSYYQKLLDIAGKLSLNVATSIKSATQDTDILFLSNATDSALATAYKKAKIFICLSDHEGFCVPIVEAISAGLPVVAHKSSAIVETGSQCKLICKQDMGETIDAILELSKNRSSNIDAGALTDLKENSKRLIEIISKVVESSI
jgi:glycosyltransferase involved in cell wall biosynthesis